MAHKVIFGRDPAEYRLRYIDWIRTLGLDPNLIVAEHGIINDDATEVTFRVFVLDSNGKRISDSSTGRCKHCGRGDDDPISLKYRMHKTVQEDLVVPLIADPKDYDLIVLPV